MINGIRRLCPGYASMTNNLNERDEHLSVAMMADLLKATSVRIEKRLESTETESDGAFSADASDSVSRELLAMI